MTGTSPYCFPARNHKEDTHIGVKTVSKQVGDRQIQFKTRKDLSRRANDNALVLKSGSHREWTPHDMRRTGATMMQALGILPDIIDRCQNHVMAGSRVRRHYLHTSSPTRRRLPGRGLMPSWDRTIRRCPLRPHKRRRTKPEASTDRSSPRRAR